MPKVLSAEQIARYERDGAIAPISIMSCEDAKALRTRSEELKRVIDGELQSRFRVKAHPSFPWLCDLIRHPVLDRTRDQYRRAMKAHYEQ